MRSMMFYCMDVKRTESKCPHIIQVTPSHTLPNVAILIATTTEYGPCQSEVCISESGYMVVLCLCLDGLQSIDPK